MLLPCFAFPKVPLHIQYMLYMLCKHQRPPGLTYHNDPYMPVMLSPPKFGQRIRYIHLVLGIAA